MRIQAALMICLSFSPALAAARPLHQAFNSQQAYEYTGQIAGIGERWPGSQGHQRAEEFIRRILEKDHAR